MGMNKKERAEKRRALQQLYQETIGLANIIETLIIITGVTALIVLVVWSLDGFGVTAQMMLLLFAVSVLLFFIHHSGRASEAGIGLFATITIVITALSYYSDGIYNVPHIFYPILLIFSGILFGRAMIPTITALITFIETFLFALDRAHLIVPFKGAVYWKADYYALAVIILFATAFLLSISLKTIEENLMRLALSEKVIKESYELTLEGWAKALELSGREPKGHSERVTKLIMEFADDLGLDDETKAQLRHGALLHDIGKMGVSDSILTKPGPLDEYETAQSKEHTLFAKKMLHDIAYLESLTDIPAYHHEQWDGKGYPEGLDAERIPYTARIFSLIDNWVSLTSHQSYRPAWSHEKAFAYIEEQAGKKFDKTITEDFLSFLRKKSEAKDEL